MKINVLTSLLFSLFLVNQSVSAKGSLISLINPNTSSGFIADNELKVLGQETHKLHIKNIIFIYQIEIINGFKISKNRGAYIQQHYDSNSRALSQCALIAAAKKNNDFKALILDNHLIYFVRALAIVTGDPKLEDSIVKKREASYDTALLKMKKDLKGFSLKHKQRHKLWNKKCQTVLNKVLDINRTAQGH